MNVIDCTELKKILNYDSQTGVFTWISDMGRRVKAGQIAGCLHHSGYLQIRYNQKSYLAHRLAWLYVHGEWPKKHLDHINGIKSQNNIDNLRQVSHAENTQNLKSSRGTTGFLGVSIDTARKNRWSAKIKLNGKSKHLGWFKTPEEAHQAYVTAKRQLHPFGTI